MITRENIIHFYTKYKENLKTEDQIKEGLLKAENQEVWIENLKNKARTMRRLYIENEALLNLYIRPFLDGEVWMDDELAEEFLHQIRIADTEGFEDNPAMLEILEILDGYFQRNNNLDSYIWTLNLLGNMHNRPFCTEDGKKGMEYFKRLRALTPRYFEISDPEVRKRIFFSYYNLPVIIMNFSLGTASEILQYIDEALAFYNDEKIRALDGERFDFDGIIKELNYDLLGNSVLQYSKKEIDQTLLSRAVKVLGEYYERELAKNPNPYEMLDEIYCNYKLSQFYLGKLTCTELLEDYRSFCEYSMKNDSLDSQKGVGFSDSRYFQVVVNHLPTILELMEKYKDEYHGRSDIREFCVSNYVRVIRSLSRTENDTFVNDVVWRSLGEILKYASEDEVNTLLLMQIMVSRDESTALHSAMVEQFARRILIGVIKKKPELLIGTFGCENVVEVLENQENILDFVSQAAWLLDIGMIQLASVVNKQSRQLTAREKENLIHHAAAGAQFLEDIPSLCKYSEAVLGHHKSWDGKMGYPAEFDNSKSEIRFLIEILHISDCLDAGTDFVSRSYKQRKKLPQMLEEFHRGKGSIYCPELVELLQEDQKLQGDLQYLTGPGRIRTCYSVYSRAVDQNAKEGIHFRVDMESWDEKEDQQISDGDTILDFLHKSGEENRQLLGALAKNSLIILYVDMLSGEYKVSYRGRQRMLDEKIPDGLYQEFLKRYLAPNMEVSDWEKIRLKVKLSELSRIFMEQDGSYECEGRVKVRGIYRWVRFQFICLDDENAMPTMMTVIATDVQESHSRNEQMMNSLKDAYKSAEEANKAKSVFLSSMSHDIRTPMNGILGMTQIAMNHLDEPERILDCLKKIDNSSRHLLGLINEVLDMSKIESGDVALQEEPLYLTKTMEIIDGVCRPMAMEKKLIFDMDIEGIRNDHVIADPVRLRQVLINLISNAVKYTHENGHVFVKVLQGSSPVTGKAGYTFVVKDDGIGMSKSFQEKLFEPFSREDNSMTNVIQGTGLGLSIAKSIIMQMGGNIEVESSSGEGSTFIVKLDLTLVADDAGHDRGISGAADRGSEVLRDLTFLKGRRIMLVEDNALNREIAYELLTEPGLIVDTVKNGQEALELLAAQPEYFYELIFMDIQMPVMNGYEATKRIRTGESSYWKNMPVIAMTANVFREDECRAAECGMSGFITKPIDMDVIYCVLEKWLSENHKESGSFL